MAEEISDGQFKAEMLEFKNEMMRFVDTAGMKFDGLTSDIRSNSFKLDRLEAEVTRKFGEHDKRFDMLDGNLEILREQTRMVDVKVTDVASRVIQIAKRLAVVEAKLSLMESTLTSLGEETQQIRLELNELNEGMEILIDVKKQLDQLEIRVFQLEEKIAA